MYVPKNKDETTTCLISMVMDQNPALPNMGSIIHKYKHLLNLDSALKKLVRADSVIVSHRKNQTIVGMLVHNKYRAGGTASSDREGEATVIIIVDALEFEPEISKADRDKAMVAREGFYQTQLKTLDCYGGMNTLDSKIYI